MNDGELNLTRCVVRMVVMVRPRDAASAITVPGVTASTAAHSREEESTTANREGAIDVQHATALRFTSMSSLKYEKLSSNTRMGMTSIQFSGSSLEKYMYLNVPSASVVETHTFWRALRSGETSEHLGVTDHPR